MPANYKLSSLEIKNFRQYRDAKITFSSEPTQIFTILRGANGAGKTNIMNAITWCLYGTEKHLDSDEKDLPIVNTKELQEKPTGLLRMYVKLILSDEHGDKFRIERRLSLFNDGGTKIITDKDTGLSIPEKSTPTITRTFQIYDPSKGWETTEYFDKSVQELLPEDLAIYFLFDGEKLEDFFEQIDDTKKGIEDVSQIKITEKAIDHLEELISKIRKNVKNLDPQKEKFKNIMDERKNELENKKKDIEDVKDVLNKKKEKLRELEQHLVKSGGNIAHYQEQVNKLKKQIEYIAEQHIAAESDRNKYVLQHLYGIESLSVIDDALKLIESKANEGILPPKIKDTFLKELLDTGKCICGNDISNETPSRKSVQSHLQKAQYSEINEICTELKFELKPVLEINDIKSELTKKEQIMLEHSDERKKRQEERADFEAKIGNADDSKIQKWQHEKQNLDKDVEEFNQKLGVLKNEVDELVKQCAADERSYDKEVDKDSRNTHLTRQRDFCQNAQSELKRIKNQLLHDVRLEVQKYTQDYFLKLVWKKNTYVGVNISENYSITARHVDGYDIRKSLSKGEKLILALSFMTALRKITGFAFPIIIDTPLGRVSGEPRYNIANLLPSFMKGNQVTLLVTDSEYQAEITDDDSKQKFPPIRDIINKYVGEDYDIGYSDGISRVIKR